MISFPDIFRRGSSVPAAICHTKDNPGMSNRKPLTSSELRMGQERYVAGSLFNGIAFACLADNVLLLYGIKNGIGPVGQGLLASLVFLTMPCIFIGRYTMARIGCAKTWGGGFFLRGLCASLMATAPFFRDWYGEIGAQAVIVLGAMGFFAFRSSAAATFAAMVGEITNERDRGTVMARASVSFQSLYLVFILLVSWLVGMDDGDRTYQGVILIGTIAGMYAGTRFWGIPETDAPRMGARTPIMESIKTIWREDVLRREVFCQIAVYTANALVLSFSMLALKRGYEVSDRNALLFSIVSLCGSIVCNRFCQLVSDTVGPRPLLLIFSCGTMACSLLWSLAPDQYMVFFPVMVFFLVGFFTTGATFSMSHYIQVATPKKLLVGVGMMCQLSAGIVAGGAGTLIGGVGIRILEEHNFTGLAPYHYYFAAVFFLQFGLLKMVAGLVPQKDWRVRDILGLAGSFRDIRTFMVIGSMGTAETPEEEREQLDTLGSLQSRVSEETLLDYLDSPDFTIRYQAVEHLGRLEFGERTVQALIRELKTGQYTTAAVAARCLGKRRVREAIGPLREALGAEDVYLRAYCIYALSTMEDTESYDRIRQAFAQADNPRILIHGARALVRMGTDGDFRQLIERAFDPELPAEVRRELCLDIARFGGCLETYYRFIRMFMQDEKTAFRDLADDFRTRIDASVTTRAEMAALLTRLEGGLPPEHVRAVVVGLTAGSSDSQLSMIQAVAVGAHVPDSATMVWYCLLVLVVCRLDRNVRGGEDEKPESPESLTQIIRRDMATRS